MVDRSGHDFTSDWWSLGIMIYEMLIGVTPFFNQNRNKLLTKIKTGKVVFPDRKKYKIKYTDELKDIVLRLLDKDKSTRLGSQKDVQDLFGHPWFHDIDIQALE